MERLYRSIVVLWKADPEKKKKNEAEDEDCEMSQEDQFKANFFLPLTNHAICCLINSFEQMHTKGGILDFLYNQENLLRVRARSSSECMSKFVQN